ncbi:hypothetical protein CCO03_02095 [Comamonas serinivorans]|uniref:Uncharacterized protein n=1 Tax=Comamonas serinivorans TaxID=1082851 RepID=A0A1Y0EJ72_9BURK|nr:hypothetical protein [Comamonas serinivorans]ARU03637.1 hypothetical protein CCO03_02095 [Comamonas serinivorans]
MDVLIYRAGIVALIALYATVLLRVMQPEVSPAYRDYYITRDSTLSPHEAQALGSLPPVRPGDHLTHQATVLAFARGWSHAEATHRWTNRRQAEIVFRIQDPQAFQGHIRLRVHTLGKQRVQISLNGHPVYAGRLQGRDRLIDLQVEPGRFKAGHNALTFQLPDARFPLNGDTRLLALAIQSLDFE